MGLREDIKPLPSVERLNELLSYDEDTGALRWRVLPATIRSNICFNNRVGGTSAGTVGSGGYLVVGIKRRYYLAHRLIWKIETGQDPGGVVDHIDGNKLNNRFSNLRLATHGQNIQNSKLRVDNASGVKGVHWDVGHKKWRAVLTTNGNSVRIGRFDSIYAARNAIEHMRAEMHGAFARVA